MPLLGAAPVKLKPSTENTPRVSGCASMTASACLATFVVYSSDAPDGAWMIVMM